MKPEPIWGSGMERKAKTVGWLPVLVFWAALTLGHLPALSQEGPQPHFQKRGDEFRLVLPKEMKAALKASFPKFRPWELSDFLEYLVKKQYGITNHQTPFAVIGDFNGDGAPDVVVYGRDTRQALIVAVLSGPKGYEASLVRKGPIPIQPYEEWTPTAFDTEYGLDECLFFIPKNEKIDLEPDPKTGRMLRAQWPVDSFEFNFRFKESSFYHWKNGKFEVLTSGC